MPGRRTRDLCRRLLLARLPQHGRKTPFTGPNAQLWQDKMVRNRMRDERSSALASSLGWLVERVWECEVRETPERSLVRL